MFDINKILGTKKSKNNSFSFTGMNLSQTIGKNPISSLLNMSMNPKPKNVAPLYKQKQWANFPFMKQQQLRMKLKDSDGDRIPDMFDCQPGNAMRQDSKPNKLQLARIQKLNIAAREWNGESLNVSGNKQKWNNLMGTLKRYPELITDFEKRPKVSLSGIGNKDIEKGDSDRRSDGTIFAYEQDGVQYDNIAVDMETYAKPSYRARVIKHELTHTDQLKKFNNEEKIKYITAQKNIPYNERPMELEAQRKAFIMDGRHKMDNADDVYGRYGEFSFKKKNMTYPEAKTEMDKIEEDLDKKYDEHDNKTIFNIQNSMNMFNSGAPIEKQKEWANKSQVERNQERETKTDTDVGPSS